MKKVIILAMTVSIWVSGICNPIGSNAVYESAKQEWMKNSILNTTEVAYARTSSGDCSNSLDINGRKEINYK